MIHNGATFEHLRDFCNSSHDKPHSLLAKKKQQLFIRRSLYRCYFLSRKTLDFSIYNWDVFFLSFSSSKVLNEGHYDILNTCDDRRLVVKAVTVDHLYNEPIIIPVLINDKWYFEFSRQINKSVENWSKCLIWVKFHRKIVYLGVQSLMVMPSKLWRFE